jgi:hypothetical protein
MSQTRAAFTRRARFALPIGGRSDAGRADRALTPLFRALVFVSRLRKSFGGGGEGERGEI